MAWPRGIGQKAVARRLEGSDNCLRVAARPKSCCPTLHDTVLYLGHRLSFVELVERGRVAEVTSSSETRMYNEKETPEILILIDSTQVQVGMHTARSIKQHVDHVTNLHTHVLFSVRVRLGMVP